MFFSIVRLSFSFTIIFFYKTSPKIIHSYPNIAILLYDNHRLYLPKRSRWQINFKPSSRHRSPQKEIKNSVSRLRPPTSQQLSVKQNSRQNSFSSIQLRERNLTFG